MAAALSFKVLDVLSCDDNERVITLKFRPANQVVAAKQYVSTFGKIVSLKFRVKHYPVPSENVGTLTLTYQDAKGPHALLRQHKQGQTTNKTTPSSSPIPTITIDASTTNDTTQPDSPQIDSPMDTPNDSDTYTQNDSDDSDSDNKDETTDDKIMTNANALENVRFKLLYQTENNTIMTAYTGQRAEVEAFFRSQGFCDIRHIDTDDRQVHRMTVRYQMEHHARRALRHAEEAFHPDTDSDTYSNDSNEQTESDSKKSDEKELENVTEDTNKTDEQKVLDTVCIKMPNEKTREEVTDYFTRFGQIERFNIVQLKDKQTGQPIQSYIAFIQYVQYIDAQDAIMNANSMYRAKATYARHNATNKTQNTINRQTEITHQRDEQTKTGKNKTIYVLIPKCTETKAYEEYFSQFGPTTEIARLPPQEKDKDTEFDVGFVTYRDKTDAIKARHSNTDIFRIKWKNIHTKEDETMHYTCGEVIKRNDWKHHTLTCTIDRLTKQEKTSDEHKTKRTKTDTNDKTHDTDTGRQPCGCELICFCDV